ncbi:hypothetical protein HN011_007728 [Eciton burchellii]|nr:hypothetical protein HN011_007728 [Eciton burchellii]
MSINKLCAAFRNIAVGRINSTAAVARYSTRLNSVRNTVSRLAAISCNQGSHGMESVDNIKFISKTLNIDFDTHGDLRKSIIDMPITRIPPLHEPVQHLPIEYDSPTLEKYIDLPTNGDIFEKQAAHLIVIRRKKMKKHKRRKLAKRMKFVWEKLRIKRKQKKEKIFQGKLIRQVKKAQAFDAKKYVQEKLEILNKEWIPKTYRGEILSREMIKKFIDEKRAKKEAKRNKVRLTL